MVTPSDLLSEGFVLVRNALANDTDLDGDQIKLIELNGSSANVGAKLTVKFGQMVVFDNGDVYYKFDRTDPDYVKLAQGQTETESFPYKITDETGATATSVISVTVAGRNDAPTAANDTARTAEDTAVKIDVLANDSDVDRDKIKLVEASLPALTANGGTVKANADGTVTYTPAKDFTGVDTFNYSITDGKGQTATAKVTVTVVSENDAPDANNDAFTVSQDQTAKVVVGNILANDTDADNDTLAVSQINGSSASVGQAIKLAGGGVVRVGSDGSVTFDAGNDFKQLKDGETAKTSFTYQAADGKGGVDTATVTFTVAGKNDAPDAVNDAFVAKSTASSSDAVTYDALANDFDVDGDKLSVIQINDSAAGVGQWVDLAGGGRAKIGADGKVQFDGDGDFSGLQTGQTAQTSFTYTVSDGNGGTDKATVIFRIEGQNDSPDARDDVATTNEDTAVKVNVLSNDRDPEGDSLIVDSIVTQPKNGTAKINADGTITYAPKANFSGTDSLVYKVSDGNGGFDTARVTFNVKPINDDPTAGADRATLTEDTSVKVDVLRNDTDVDGDNLFVDAITSGPANGRATINADGTITYTPNTNFTGEDKLVYRVSDGNGGSDTATVTFTVNGVNDNPDAIDDRTTVNEDARVVIDVLANDVEPDGDKITLDGIVSGPKNGVVVVNANGTLTYKPNADFNGTDTLTYAVSDGKGGTDTAKVTITVLGVNDGPDARNDSVTLNEDSSITVDVLANDVDKDGDKLTLDSILTAPKNGTAKINADGTITYIPNANFSGLDSLVYKVSDGKGGFDAASVRFNVTPTNDAPDANDDRVIFNEDSSITVNVLRNDTDRDADKLTVDSIVTGPKNGVAKINADGTITYKPNADFTGRDELTYKVSDGNGGFDTAKVIFGVKPVNDAPDANDDLVTVNEDTKITVDVLKNDKDVDGDKLVIDSIVSGPQNGVVKINADGTITYAPNADFVGTDSLVYKVSDGKGGFDTATVTFKVQGVDDAPRAANDTATTAEDNAVKIDVLANDFNADAGDNLKVAGIETAPQNGTVKINSDGTVTYTPNANFNGVDSFVYRVTDNAGNSDSARVNVTVRPVNDGPDANDDVVRLFEDSFVKVDVLKNDVDVDGDKLTLDSIVTGPKNGSIVINSDGTLTYKPNADFNGTDTVVYRVSDGNGGFDNATVTFKVAPVNDAPVGNDDRVTIGEDTPVTVDVVRNDTDKDGDPLKLDSIVEGPKNGTVKINPDGTLTYTPNKDYNGPDSVIYKVTDGKGGEGTAKVTFNVTPENDAPVAVDDKVQTDEDTTKTFDILKNDFDVDNDTLTVTKIITGPSHGTVKLNADGTITYDPVANYNGTDTIVYQITDGNGEFSQAKVTIQVGPINDDPNANEDDIIIGDDNNGVNSADDNVVVDDSDTGVGSQDDNVVVDDSAQSDAATNNSVGGFTKLSSLSDAPSSINAAIKNAGTTPETADSLIAKGFKLVRNVLDNDTDLDGDQIRVIQLDGSAANVGVVLGVKYGQMSILKNGELYFKLDKALPEYVSLAQGQKGSEGFTYKITDETGATASSKISVTVVGRNDGPDAKDDSASYAQNETGGVKDALNLLANDTDPDKLDKLTVKQVNGVEANVGQWVKLAQGGSVLVGADGSVDFRADGDFVKLGDGQTATTSFSYQVSDGKGGVDTANAVFTVGGANDGPDAKDDAASFNATEGVGGAPLNLLANDTDPDGNTLNVSQVNGSAGNVGQWVQLAGKGWAKVNSDGSVDFDARGEFNNLKNGESAQTSLTYQVSDGKGGFDTATATFNVTGVNTAPDAKDDFASVVSKVTQTVTAVQVLKDGSFESADVNACTWKYLPEVGAWKTDSTIEIWGDKYYGIKATDGTKVLELDADHRVSNVYQNVQTESGVEYEFKFDYAKRPDSRDGTDTINVFWNGKLVGSVDPASKGWSTASFKVVGTGGSDRIEFRESAGQNDNYGGVIDNVSLTKYVTQVTSGSDSVTLNVLTNDVDPDNDRLTLTSVNGNASNVGQWIHLDKGGWAKVNADGSTTFEARGDFDALKGGATTQTSLTYQISDGRGGFDTATATFNVTGVNSAPDAKDDAATYSSKEAGGAWDSLNLLSNDTDSNNDALTVTKVNGSEANLEKWVHLDSGGWVYVGRDGKLDFSAGDDFKGLKGGDICKTTFTYEISDGNGGIDKATVVLTVEGANNAPCVVNDCFTAWGWTNDYGSIEGNLLNNDSDPDCDKLTVTEVTYKGVKYELKNGVTEVKLGDKGDSVKVYSDGRVDAKTSFHIFLQEFKDLSYKAVDGKGGCGEACFTIKTPIALDLNHNGKIDVTGETSSFDKTGVTQIGATVKFDIDSDGKQDTVEWLKGTGDGFLVDNRDGHAASDMDGSRLFGDDNGTYGHGYDKLATLDANNDGVLNGQELNGLNIWVDNGDAQVQDGELVTLAQYGINELSVNVTLGKDAEGRGLIQSDATTSGGEKILTEDVWFLKQEDQQNQTHDLHDLRVDPLHHDVL